MLVIAIKIINELKLDSYVYSMAVVWASQPLWEWMNIIFNLSNKLPVMNLMSLRQLRNSQVRSEVRSCKFKRLWFFFKKKTAKETQMYSTIFWTLWEKARVGWSERIALKHVYYHMWNRSPVQVRYMRQGAQGCCTEMTLRDELGREVWGGFRMGNTCTPMADSYQYGKNHYNIVK